LKGNPLSTTLLEPTVNPSEGVTDTPPQRWSSNSVLVLKCENRHGITAPCRAELSVSSNGRESSVIGRRVFSHTGGAVSFHKFVLSDFCAMQIGALLPPYESFSVKFSGNLGAAVVVSAYLD
jgi:hypothetical protein